MIPKGRVVNIHISAENSISQWLSFYARRILADASGRVEGSGQESCLRGRIDLLLEVF